MPITRFARLGYYYASITGVDEQFGRILKQLEQSKLADNIIVLFMADHDNCLGKHNEISKNNIYEESLRIPFIVKWKGHIKPNMDDEYARCLSNTIRISRTKVKNTNRFGWT